MALSQPPSEPESAELETQRILDLLEIQKLAIQINDIQMGNIPIPRDYFHDVTMLKHWVRAKAFVLPLVPTWDVNTLHHSLVALCREIDDIPCTLFRAAEEGVLTRKRMRGINHRVSDLDSLFKTMQKKNSPLAQLIMTMLQNHHRISMAVQRELGSKPNQSRNLEGTQIHQPFDW